MGEIVIRGDVQRQYAIQTIAGLDLSKPWRVTIKRFVKARSNPQLALYWEWLGIISKETGNDKDDLHEFFKRKFLTPEIKEVLGTEVAIYSTAGPAQVMTEFMNSVFIFANSVLGCFLPLPTDERT